MINKTHEMRLLFRMFSFIKGFDGWMIGRLHFFKGEDKEKLPSASVIKQKKTVAVLESIGKGIGIQMTVVKPKSITEGEHKENHFSLPEACVPVVSRTFSREEILEFTKDVQDDNWIHQTQHPIVPGFLMVEWVWETGGISLTDCTMIFRAPGYAGQEIVIYQEPSALNYYAVTTEQKSGSKQENVRLLWEIRKDIGKR